MRFDVITIFPEFFSGPLDFGIVRRAREAGIIETHIQDLREFTHDRHRTVDDRPFGGGEGMVLKPEPLFAAVESLTGITDNTAIPPRTAVILLSASGKLFRQQTARRMAQLERLVFICGRYEGVDERVAQHLATDEISIGDFVLSGGELPAALIIDAVTRLLPGALGNEDSTVNESFSANSDIAMAENKSPDHEGAEAGHTSRRDEPSGAAGSGLSCQTAPDCGILDYPHYTRPHAFKGWSVPEVLLGGNHKEIRSWRRRMALEKTLRNRPELIERASLNEEDRRTLRKIRAGDAAFT